MGSFFRVLCSCFLLLLSSATWLGADIIGNSDDRREVRASDWPFVAEVIWINDDHEPVIVGTAWQPFDARVAVTAAHLMAQDGRFFVNGTLRRPGRRDLSRFLVRPAGCAQGIPLRSIEGYGTLDPGADPSGDWMVVLLDQPSCLEQDELAQPRILDTSLSEKHFLPGAARKRSVEMVAFADRTSLGRTLDGNEPALWTAKDSALVQSSGSINHELRYKFQGDGMAAIPVSDGDTGSDIRSIWGHLADADEGNSGGILAVRRVNGGRGVVVGMTSTEVTTPGVQQNYAVPYRFMAGAVEAAVRKSRRLAKTR